MGPCTEKGSGDGTLCIAMGMGSGDGTLCIAMGIGSLCLDSLFFSYSRYAETLD